MKACEPFYNVGHMTQDHMTAVTVWLPSYQNNPFRGWISTLGLTVPTRSSDIDVKTDGGEEEI